MPGQRRYRTPWLALCRQGHPFGPLGMTRVEDSAAAIEGYLSVTSALDLCVMSLHLHKLDLE